MDVNAEQRKLRSTWSHGREWYFVAHAAVPVRRERVGGRWFPPALRLHRANYYPTGVLITEYTEYFVNTTTYSQQQPMLKGTFNVFQTTLNSVPSGRRWQEFGGKKRTVLNGTATAFRRTNYRNESILVSYDSRANTKQNFKVLVNLP